MDASQVLDCTGLNCPMPIVRLSQAMRGIESGAKIVIEANDPAFRADLEAWVRRFGHTILAFDEGSISRATVLKK
jgi:tRNA 2-thiouridine synthesizing protein A